MSVDTTVFCGVTFRRYPDADTHADRVYYTPGIADRQRGIGRLHVEVWKHHHGRDVPPGCHVHHVNGDPLDNRPENLECVEADEHRRHHAPEHSERAQRPDRLAHLEAIRPLAAEWHRSEAGRAWHREHGRAVWAKREPLDLECEQCGAAYSSVALRGRFCSNACKSAWRRDAGLDDEQRECAWCGAEFTINHYSRTRCCSRSCAKRWGDAKRT